MILKPEPWRAMDLDRAGQRGVVENSHVATARPVGEEHYRELQAALRIRAMPLGVRPLGDEVGARFYDSFSRSTSDGPRQFAPSRCAEQPLRKGLGQSLMAREAGASARA